VLTGALIGAGNIALNGHLPAYLGSEEVRASLRITAVADLCPENLAIIANALPGVRTYSDPEALLVAERPEFVDICAPPFAHRQLIERAIDAGCHVVCEKPLATDLADALAIHRSASRSGRVIFPCHQYHYAPQWSAMRLAIESDEVGPIRLGLLTVQRTGANAGNAAWNPSWRTDERLAGGGILVDHGTHLFYQLQSVFGPPREISCRTERRLPGCNVDDTTTIYLHYTSRTIRIYLTWASQARFSSHRYLGSRGEVACLDDRITVRTDAGEREIPFAEGLSQGSAHSEWFAPLLVEFADRVVRRDFRTDRLDEAVDVAACISLAYASAAQGGRPLPWRDPLAEVDSYAYAAAGD
jgi:predicted dehydrogenase